MSKGRLNRKRRVIAESSDEDGEDGEEKDQSRASESLIFESSGSGSDSDFEDENIHRNFQKRKKKSRRVKKRKQARTVTGSDESDSEEIESVGNKRDEVSEVESSEIETDSGTEIIRMAKRAKVVERTIQPDNLEDMMLTADSDADIEKVSDISEQIQRTERIVEKEEHIYLDTFLCFAVAFSTLFSSILGDPKFWIL